MYYEYICMYYLIANQTNERQLTASIHVWCVFSPHIRKINTSEMLNFTDTDRQLHPQCLTSLIQTDNCTPQCLTSLIQTVLSNKVVCIDMKRHLSIGNGIAYAYMCKSCLSQTVYLLTERVLWNNVSDINNGNVIYQLKTTGQTFAKNCR